MTNRVYAMEFLFLLQCTLAYLAELFLIVPAPNVLCFVFLFFVKHCFSPPMRKIPSAIIFTSRLGRRHKSSQRGGGFFFQPPTPTQKKCISGRRMKTVGFTFVYLYWPIKIWVWKKCRLFIYSFFFFYHLWSLTCCITAFTSASHLKAPKPGPLIIHTEIITPLGPLLMNTTAGNTKECCGVSFFFFFFLSYGS